MKYTDMGKAEMKPDIYGGKNCDEHVPQWECIFGDDREPVNMDEIILDSKIYPAGTKITIEFPICPKCEMIQEICECDFDWKNWIEKEYS